MNSDGTPQHVAHDCVGTILHYNRPGSLDEVIKRVLGGTVLPREILVLDNGSDPPLSLPSIESPIPVTVLHCDKNIGVGAGHNYLVRTVMHRVDTQKVWLLEHDTLVTKDCLAQLIESSISCSPCVIQPKLARSAYDCAMMRTQGLDSVALNWGEITLNGVLIPIEIFKKAGLFNEHLIAGGEDQEWSIRARSCGTPILMTVACLGIHRTWNDRLFRMPPSAMRHFFSTRNGFVLSSSRATRTKLLLHHLVGIVSDVVRYRSPGIARARANGIVAGLRGQQRLLDQPTMPANS